MRNDLTKEQLAQEVTVVLPLSAVLQISALQPMAAKIEKFTNLSPDIGQKGMYGIYAGNARGYNGEPDGVLEALDEAPKPMKWDEAMKWAESIGGRLPTRKEQALMFANVPELFKPEAYWSCEQHADDAVWAWYQDFLNGNQYDFRKTNKLRARAVRRLPFE